MVGSICLSLTSPHIISSRFIHVAIKGNISFLWVSKFFCKLTFYTNAKLFSEERTVFSANDIGKTKYPHAQEKSWTLINNLQKLTQILLKI